MCSSQSRSVKFFGISTLLATRSLIRGLCICVSVCVSIYIYILLGLLRILRRIKNMSMCMQLSGGRARLQLPDEISKLMEAWVRTNSNMHRKLRILHENVSKQRNIETSACPLYRYISSSSSSHRLISCMSLSPKYSPLPIPPFLTSKGSLFLLDPYELIERIRYGIFDLSP